MADKTDDILDATRADPNDPMSLAAFEGPAVYADRVLVSERGGVVRISVAETNLGGDLHFRGAIAVTMEFADELAQILAAVVNKAKADHG
ncbi:hypothetical protein NM680_10800 [Paracoccus sp. PS-1]|uniref:hypothetical protein n=1 Tax=Paracoccus sp. PS1 TaxID=2963938 RepID=UPI0027E5B85A|nr:hypothetical protein [Paracoccus sp. PS1]MDQ7262282.1 hypothetical protein [Paracoccus sp. PS1]